MRAPVADKTALLRTMVGEMVRHIGLNMVLAMVVGGVLAAASVWLGLGRSAPEWITFMLCLNLGTLGLVAQGVGQALILRRFEVVGTTINWITLLLWAFALAWIVPPFTMPLAYAASLLGVGCAWGGLLCVLWYRRFYERADYALTG